MKTTGRLGHLRADELRRIARGADAGAGELQHLASCGECRDELDLLDVLDRSRSFAPPRDPCPDPETLVELADGFLAKALQDALQDHLTACATCCAEVEALSHADSRAGAPPILRVERPPLSSRVLAALRKLVVLDPPLLAAPALRGGAAPARSAARREKPSAEDAARRGATLLREGRAREAQEALAVAVEASPRRADYRYALAQAQLALGQVDEALAQLDKCAASRGDLRDAARDQARRVRELLD